MQTLSPITQDQYDARQEALKNARIFKLEIPEPDMSTILQLLQFTPSPWAVINPIMNRLNSQIAHQLQQENESSKKKLQSNEID